MKAFGRSNRPFSPTDWIYGKKKPFLTRALRVHTSNVLTRISMNTRRSKVARINLLASRVRLPVPPPQSHQVVDFRIAGMPFMKTLRVGASRQMWHTKGKRFNLLRPASGPKTYGGLGAFAGLGRGWKRFLRSRKG